MPTQNRGATLCMSIFNRKIKKKHIDQFGTRIAELLYLEMPQLKTANNLSSVHGIAFMHQPKGIYVTRGYTPEAFEIINRNHKTSYYLSGISVFNNKQKGYRPLRLYYQSDTLTRIEVENPEYFHKEFDLTKVQKSKIELEHLKKENPDRKVAERALGSLSEKQLELLDLDYTFEIEFDEQLYYTILDMEDGNYIAVDKKGKIYRLNHDHKERIRLIAENPIDFFKLYKGQKRELENIMYQ